MLMRTCKRGPSCSVGGNEVWCSHCRKHSGVSSKILKVEPPYEPGKISKRPQNTNLKTQNTNLKNTCTPIFIRALFTMANIWRQPRCALVNQCIKSCGTFVQWNLLTCIKKKEFLPFGTAWVDLESITLSEISQPGKDKYYMISVICGSNEQGKLTKKIEADSQKQRTDWQRGRWLRAG